MLAGSGLNAKLNLICHLLALLGAHHILHDSRIRVKELYTFWTDLLSIIRCLNTVHTAIGICHAEILKVGKITRVYTCIL